MVGSFREKYTRAEDAEHHREVDYNVKQSGSVVFSRDGV